MVQSFVSCKKVTFLCVCICSVVQMARERLEYLFSQSAYDFEQQDLKYSLPDILLDVANYKEDELTQDSLHLLNRYYSTEITLFLKAIQTQLLVTDKSEKVFEEVCELLPVLRRYLSIEVKEKGRAEIVRILKRFTEMCCLEGDEQEPHPQNQKILYNYGEYTAICVRVCVHVYT